MSTPCVITAGALALLAGCNQWYGLDDTVLDEPRECATIRFGAPRQLAQFSPDGPGEFDPQLSTDLRELWFVRSDADGFRIYHARRATPDADFDPPLLASFAQTNAGDPALSKSGRRLVYVDNYTVLEAKRDDPASDDFDLLTVVGLPRITRGLDRSHDGLRIYFVQNDALYVASRPSLDEPFEAATHLFDHAEMGYPTVSPDELEVFYANIGGARSVFRRVRGSRTSDFEPAEMVLDNAADPDISPTGEVMVVAESNGLFVLERACP